VRERQVATERARARARERERERQRERERLICARCAAGGMPVKKAVGSSLLIICLNAASAFLSYTDEAPCPTPHTFPSDISFMILTPH